MNRLRSQTHEHDKPRTTPTVDLHEIVARIRAAGRAAVSVHMIEQGRGSRGPNVEEA